MNGQTYLTPRDVQEALKIGRSLAYQLFSSKDFPVIRLGRKLLVRSDLFDQWVQDTFVAQAGAVSSRHD